MANIELIVAMDENQGIGQSQKLPWQNIKADMAIFKKVTEGHSVIAGRDTYLSIPKNYRPLESRQNVIVTSRNLEDESKYDNVETAKSLVEAIDKCNKNKIILIGGSGIYKEGLNNGLVDKVRISHINTDQITPRFDEYNPDTYLKGFNQDEWVCIEEQPHELFTHRIYVRKD